MPARSQQAVLTCTRSRPDANRNNKRCQKVHMEMKVEHIGIATRSIEEALGFWRDALGLEVRHTETVEEQGVRVAMLPVGASAIELLEPTGDSSPVAKFLERRGPGTRMSTSRPATCRSSSKGLAPRQRRSRNSLRARRSASRSQGTYAACSPRQRRRRPPATSRARRQLFKRRKACGANSRAYKVCTAHGPDPLEAHEREARTLTACAAGCVPGFFRVS